MSQQAHAGSWALPAGVMLVAAIAPFERPLPVALFGLTLTTVELAIVIALALGGAAWLREPKTFSWRTPISLPLAAMVVCAIVAAVAAPEFRGQGIRVAARLAAAAMLFVLVANVASSVRLARGVIAALLGAAALVGVIAVLELAQLPWVLNALKAFRPGFHVVGGQLRATSTLFYPTITSMFLEIAFALGLVWLASPRLRSGQASRAAFAALVLTGAGIIATFTRAGLITMTVSLLVFGGALLLRPASQKQRPARKLDSSEFRVLSQVFSPRGAGPRDAALARRSHVLVGLRRSLASLQWTGVHTRLAALASVLIALVLLSRSPQMLVARISAEGSQEWYGASYSVPQRLTLRPDSFNDIPVTLTNQGRLTWQSTTVPPFAISYHWLTPDTEEVVIFDGLRTPFERPVTPGASVTMSARVRAPGYPGRYVLIWDVVQEHRTWLSLEGVYPGRSVVSVEGAPAGAPLPSRGRMPSSVMRMPRLVLWSTALKIWRERPLLGIGPDNFRHTYGRSLGMAAWDARVHANNSYIEVLVGMGAIGAVALIWLAFATLKSVPRILSRSTDDTLPLAAAATAACLAIAAHALVDSFLTFTPTYAAFAIAAGILYSSSLRGNHHAHSV